MLRMIRISELDILEQKIASSKAVDRMLTEFLLNHGVSCPEEKEKIRYRLIQLSIEKLLMKTGYFKSNKHGLSN